MQEEFSQKTIAVSIKAVKLTADLLRQALTKLLAEMEKTLPKSTDIKHGKQSIKSLSKQNAGLSSIEITDQNIKSFEHTAKKYGIDFALKKDASEIPPKYIVFFKGRDADAMTSSFKEFVNKQVKQHDKLSLLKALAAMKETVKSIVPIDKVKNKDRGLEL